MARITGSVEVLSSLARTLEGEARENETINDTIQGKKKEKRNHTSGSRSHAHSANGRFASRMLQSDGEGSTQACQSEPQRRTRQRNCLEVIQKWLNKTLRASRNTLVRESSCPAVPPNRSGQPQCPRRSTFSQRVSHRDQAP